ncbi:MAG: hypothetical protein U0791_07270 [Gemmataceae bacterium]
MVAATPPRNIESVTNLPNAMFRTMLSGTDPDYLGKAAGNGVAEIDLSAILKAISRLTAADFRYRDRIRRPVSNGLIGCEAVLPRTMERT